MAGLFHTLGIGAESLYATRQGVDTAGHNIANAQVEGYSRQRINLKARDPLQKGNLLIGNGAIVGDISRSHDKFIENQINRANQQSGRATQHAEGMKGLEIIFSPELEASVADEVTTFFNSLQDLSNYPDDFTVRTNVVEMAKNLTNSFRRVDNDLKEHRRGFNERIMQTTSSLTDNLREIASLNTKIQVLEAGQAQKANDLRDQRDKLLREVSEAIEVNYYEDQYGMMMVRGPKQVTLVDGGNSSSVEVVRNNDNDGLYDIVVRDWEQHTMRNVTDAIDGGALESLVNLRDKVVPHLLDKNNTMAFGLAKEFNAVHRQGFGLKEYGEVSGRNFFKEPANLATAASDFYLDDAIIQSHDAIGAAMSPLAPGDNVNINQLVKLKDNKIFENGGVTLNEYYANYVGSLGLEVVRATHIKDANDLMIGDLNSRREAVSGVSLDEEATNLMKWQSNFVASSKLITTIDEMLETVLSLKR